MPATPTATKRANLTLARRSATGESSKAAAIALDAVRTVGCGSDGGGVTAVLLTLVGLPLSDATAWLSVNWTLVGLTVAIDIPSMPSKIMRFRCWRASNAAAAALSGRLRGALIAVFPAPPN